MKWCRLVFQGLLTILLSLVQHSEESCEMLKKTVTIYRVERVLYRYVTCKQLTLNDEDINEQIKSSLNNSCEYLEITESNLPNINKNMFYSLNLTQLTIAAEVELIQNGTFERANISTITLENNSIRKIKDSAFKSFSIYLINLQNNRLTEIGLKTFSGAQNLRKLNLNNNSISVIQSDAFKDLGNLEELKLSFNKIVSLVQDLFSPLVNIQTIDLSNNALVDLEFDTFAKNKILQYLSLQHNRLSVLDTHLPNSLIELNVEYNTITLFNISNLVNLNVVYLNYNRISNLKKSLQNLPSLSFLHLNNNRIGNSSVFDIDAFSDLKNITVIELDNNNLDSNFDFKIFKKTKTLEGVSVVGNRLRRLDFTDFPPDIKILNASQNSLVEVKNLSKFSALFKLDLSSNSFQEIDFNMLDGLKQLHLLLLNNNTISKLAMGCFRHLKLLASLNLSFNRISNISAGIFNGLDSISELDLSYNQLTYLNEDIFHNMKNLRVLNVAYNNLTTVNMKTLSSHVIWLREIDMNGNNWTCKLLIDIIKNNKALHIVGGKYYNVSNVYGIPCRENIASGDERHYTNYEETLPEIINALNLTVDYVESISVKLSYVIVFIVLLIVILFAKFIIDKYSSQVTAAAQFVYQKSQSDPELQLI